MTNDVIRYAIETIPIVDFEMLVATTHGGRKMRKLLNSFRRDDQGISSIEYAMLAVGIALAILAGAQFLGSSINTGLSTIGTDVTTDL
jgi:pilus assembly protein Flp/PilA